MRSEDGNLQLKLAMPTTLGGKGDSTNPEQLFAAGYASCFGNAIMHTARSRKIPLLDKNVVVTATVGLDANSAGGFVLSVHLDVVLAGVDQSTADTLVASAHEICPYSNAVRGNIDVQIDTKALVAAN